MKIVVERDQLNMLANDLEIKVESKVVDSLLFGESIKCAVYLAKTAHFVPTSSSIKMLDDLTISVSVFGEDGYAISEAL